MVDRARLEAFGIAPEYPDAFGTWHHVDDDTARHLLWAMGVEEGMQAPPDSDAVIVARIGQPRPAPAGELELEDDATRRIEAELPPDLPTGYHTLHRDDGAVASVIVSPARCAPGPGRIWGWAVQLYSLLSSASWGVGDLADLRALGEWAAGEGAGVVLVNPLDAAIPEHPRVTSPYFPSTRRYRDLLYLRVEDVPGIAAVADELPGLAVRAASHGRIDRDAAVAAKLAALELLWWRSPQAGREPGFERYRAEQGRALEDLGVFMLLAEQHGGGWRSWPARFRDPRSPAVADHAAGHERRVRFHMWIQWLLDEQLATAAAAAPLMRDLPVGFDPDGFDAWVWQDVLAREITVGAPPDELGPQGQDWKLPAFVPWKLRRAAYRPFVETLRSAFRHAAALRIDHVLGLFRLFWIPPAGAVRGTYVRQPADDLLDILALESQRAGAYVVGEDLGTVGPGVRETLAARDVLRYRVLWFEDQPPVAWDRHGLGAVTTHDLPTVAGLWTRSDLDVLGALGLPVDPERIERMRTLLAERAGLDAATATAEAACVAAARLLGGAGTDVVVAQIEDAVAATHRINVPGTDETRPDNWSLPLPVRLEDLPAHPLVAQVVAALRGARR